MLGGLLLGIHSQVSYPHKKGIILLYPNSNQSQQILKINDIYILSTIITGLKNSYGSRAFFENIKGYQLKHTPFSSKGGFSRRAIFLFNIRNSSTSFIIVIVEKEDNLPFFMTHSGESKSENNLS